MQNLPLQKLAAIGFHLDSLCSEWEGFQPKAAVGHAALLFGAFACGGLCLQKQWAPGQAQGACVAPCS